MQITLYSGFSKENNSTKIPSGGTDVSCVLKEETSLIKPVFILQAGNFQTNYVKWNNRYYFVDDVVSIRNDAVELHCVVDPLASWKSEIGSSSQYVTRSASDYDQGIIDSLYPARVFETITDTELDLGFSDTAAADNYVLGVINAAGSASGGITYYKVDATGVASLLSFLYGGTWLDAPATEVSVELQKELVNPFQYIASIQSFPFSVASDGSDTIKFGYWDSHIPAGTISPSARYKNAFVGTVLPDHPQAASRGIYMNASPYTRRILHCYGFGDILLDSIDFIHSKAITLSLQVDLFNGTGKLEISNSGDATLHHTLYGQIGISIPISQVSSHTGGNPISMIMQDLKAGYVNLQARVQSAASGSAIGDAVSGLQPVVQSQGSQGSGVYYTHKPHVTSKFMNLVSIDAARNGRPLMQTRTISSLSGYVQIENPDVDIPASEYERSEIMSYMQNGFYYE